MSWGQGVAELAKKIAEYHKELVTTSVRFDELRRQTKETMEEFKGALERINVRMQDVERRHIEAQATVVAKTESIAERLNTLSEKALHVAVNDAAKKIILENVEQISKGSVSQDGNKPLIDIQPSLEPGNT